jgi:hypothetical protein
LREAIPEELRGEDTRETKSLQSGKETKRKLKHEKELRIAEMN